MTVTRDKSNHTIVHLIGGTLTVSIILVLRASEGFSVAAPMLLRTMIRPFVAAASVWDLIMCMKRSSSIPT